MGRLFLAIVLCLVSTAELSAQSTDLSARPEAGLGKEQVDLLVRRSAERAAKACAREVERAGFRLHGDADVVPTPSGFDIRLPVRRDGRSEVVECRYDLRSEEASVDAPIAGGKRKRYVQEGDEDDDDEVEVTRLPIVRAIAACVEAADADGLSYDGVIAAEQRKNRAVVQLGVDRSSDKAYRCEIGREKIALLEQRGDQWLPVDQAGAETAGLERAEKACGEALREEGASLRAVKSSERRGRRISLEIRARKDGDGFDAICRYNTRTGFASISRP